MFRACIALLLCVVSGLACAQTWNSNAGGYNTGYGTVYGSFGLAQATQNMYTTMQMNMQRATMRQAMINKWGIEAVEKAEREASEGGESSGAAVDPQIEVPPAPPVRNLGVYRPDASVDTGRQLAEALGSTPEEQALIAELFTQVKAAYEQQATALGWSNNVAGGLTFFTVTALTVYHDIEEPSEDAVANWYAMMNQTIDALPDFAATTDHDKQAFDNMLIGFSGLLLAGYTEGKQTQDAETLGTYRTLAGELIRMVLKIEPDKLRLQDGQIVVG